jgi:hypothetical protein
MDHAPLIIAITGLISALTYLLAELRRLDQGETDLPRAFSTRASAPRALG